MTTPSHANRVSETTTTTGTGTLALSGARTGYQAFGTAFGTGGNTEVDYVITDGAGLWEVGIGTFLGVSNALQRDSVKASSSGTSKVSFTSGSKTVSVVLPADPSLVGKAWRAADIPLTLRAASGQSAAIMETYRSDSTLGPVIDSGGNLKLSSNTNEMLRLPMSSDYASFIAVRRDLLDPDTVLTHVGLRHRMSGTDNIGVMQWSSGEGGFFQLRPYAVELFGYASDASRGIAFANGIRIKTPVATLGVNNVGHLAFDCEAASGNTSWDIGPVNNTGTGIHTVRFGRYSGGSTKTRLILVGAGSTTAAVTLDSSGFGKFGEYYIGADADGVASNYISRDGAQLLFMAGVNNATLASFYDDNGVLAAELKPNGTSSASAQTFITREKGDTRFAAISSLRFKRNIRKPRTDLASAFDALKPRAFVWGGEIPEGDERLGTPGLSFIAEDVVKVLPEAGRYIRDSDDTLKLQALDPLTICTVLHAKIVEQEARITKLEAQLEKLSRKRD